MAESESDESDIAKLFFANQATNDDLEEVRVSAVVSRRLFGTDLAVRVGKFRIERPIGQGAMGQVYLAVDEELKRRVALKRVKGVSSPEGYGRLQREAEMLAALDHENVVPVYEITHHKGVPFVVMAFVEGQNLREWLAEKPRPWTEILSVFLAAGRGLAAAHKVGIVHRDFKPENVLIGEEDRVRVADFGLATDQARTIDDDGESSHDETAGPRGSACCYGTLRYMPLEQARADGAEQRSDQFSFCVALYEALWGKPPFSPSSTAAERARILEQENPATPPSTRVPGKIWRILRRGLERDPFRRWPDMSSLLGALTRITGRRRLVRRATIVAAVVVAAPALTVLLRPQPGPCDHVERELDGVWDEELRAGVSDRFQELEPLAEAESARRIVLENLDEWSRHYVDVRTRICEADHSGVDQTRDNVERDACLARQRREVSLYVDWLTRATSDQLDAAINASASLEKVGDCELANSEIEPPPPEIAGDVQRLEDDIARAHHLRRIGELDDGLNLIEDVATRAAELGYGPTLARAYAEWAKAEDAAGSLDSSVERYDHAIQLADAHRLDDLRANLLLELALISIIESRDFELGRRQLDLAEAANKRVGLDVNSQCRLLLGRGRLAEADGDRSAAERAYRSAVEQSLENDTSDRDVYLQTLAALIQEDRPTEALELRREGIAWTREHFGDGHPRLAPQLDGYGLALRSLGLREQADDAHRRALAIYRSAHRRPHTDLARAEHLATLQAIEARDWSAAEHHARQMAAIQAATLPARDWRRGYPASLLARIAEHRGDTQGILDYSLTALRYFELTPEGPRHPKSLEARRRIVIALTSLSQLEEALVRGNELVSLSDSPDNRLLLVEIEILRGKPERADSKLKLIEESGGGAAFDVALFRAIINLRLDVPGDDHIARFRQVYADGLPYSQQELEQWLEQLSVTDRERRIMGLSRIENPHPGAD
jgi:tRNA A-37 threonylcarbamoyl transferase component Bud32/tetratricopeptide (TPR) repeat protein